MSSDPELGLNTFDHSLAENLTQARIWETYGFRFLNVIYDKKGRAAHLMETPPSQPENSHVDIPFEERLASEMRLDEERALREVAGEFPTTDPGEPEPETQPAIDPANLSVDELLALVKSRLPQWEPRANDEPNDPNVETVLVQIKEHTDRPLESWNSAQVEVVIGAVHYLRSLVAQAHAADDRFDTLTAALDRHMLLIEQQTRVARRRVDAAYHLRRMADIRYLTITEALATDDDPMARGKEAVAAYAKSERVDTLLKSDNLEAEFDTRAKLADLAVTAANRPVLAREAARAALEQPLVAASEAVPGGPAARRGNLPVPAGKGPLAMLKALLRPRRPREVFGS